MKYIAIFALFGILLMPTKAEKYMLKKCMASGWKKEYCNVKMTPKGPSYGISASA